MKKNILIIIVTIISLIASFPLVSCSSGPAPTPTTTSAAPATASTPVTGTPPETTAAKPVGALPTATATTPAQSTTTPTATPDLPDLKPYLVDGKSAVTVDISNPDYKKFLIKAGVTNAGKLTASNVTVELYNSATKIYTWNIGQLKNGENKILEVTIGDIIQQSVLSAGQYSLSINCVLSGGGKDANSTNDKSDKYQATLASPPIASREPQSTMEKTIRDSIINGTWYTESNKAELVTILKDILKGANISWNSFGLEIQPFDKYNDMYANYFGTTEAQKQSLKQSIASDRVTSTSFSYGNTGNAIFCIREGTLLQVLPMIMYQLGVYDYAQINYTAYSNGNKTGANNLASFLLEAYGFRVMREKYGFSGYTNISASLSLSKLSNYMTTTTWRMWALVANEGYPNGDMPADKILKAFFNLTAKPDPTSYMADLDKKADLLDKTAIENIIRWRLVNKESTSLPADISQKIGTSMLDYVISCQNFIALPW